MLDSALLPGVPLVESPFFAKDSSALLNSEQLSVARSLNERGYAIIDFPGMPGDAEIESLKNDLRPRYDWDLWRDEPYANLRLQDAWRFNDAVRQLAANKAILELLSALYGRRAIPFQTLNFPVGSQQAAHSDHVHFNSVPDRFMCGVWLALEDIDEENGPLIYYPGSHRWPSYQNEHVGFSFADLRLTGDLPNYKHFERLWMAMADAEGIAPQVFTARKGQALIWTSNLVHGGAKQINRDRTRWSQVTHYMFADCAYTTPFLNDTYQGKIYFRDLIDIGTGDHIPNIISKHRLRRVFKAMIWALNKPYGAVQLARELAAEPGAALPLARKFSRALLGKD